MRKMWVSDIGGKMETTEQVAVTLCAPPVLVWNMIWMVIHVIVLKSVPYILP